MAASLTKPFLGAPHTSTGSLLSPSLLPSRNIIQLPARRSQLKRLGLTTGSPIKVCSETQAYRPFRAYGLRPIEDIEKSVDRETTSKVVDGIRAMTFLKNCIGTDILAYVSQVHKVVLPECLVDHETLTYDQIKGSAIRCPNPEYAEKMIAAINAVSVRGDSIGGTVTCIVRNFPRSTEFRAFHEIAAAMAKGVMSLPKTVSFEIGSGFTGTFMTGGEFIDKFDQFDGLQGGINPETIKMRIAFKPIVSISKMEHTDRGDLDFCAVYRAVHFVEAMVAQELLPRLPKCFFKKVQEMK